VAADTHQTVTPLSCRREAASAATVVLPDPPNRAAFMIRDNGELTPLHR
jgi:hypothetical protein